MIMNQLVGPSGSSVGGGGDVGSCFAVVASVQHDKARRGKSLKVFVGGQFDSLGRLIDDKSEKMGKRESE